MVKKSRKKRRVLPYFFTDRKILDFCSEIFLFQKKCSQFRRFPNQRTLKNHNVSIYFINPNTLFFNQKKTHFPTQRTLKTKNASIYLLIQHLSFRKK